MSKNTGFSVNKPRPWTKNNKENQEIQSEASAHAEHLYRSFYGRGENKYAIYPSYWPGSWGKAPLLGIVSADNEFLAERLAYDKGILSPFNCTFQPKFKKLNPESRK